MQYAVPRPRACDRVAQRAHDFASGQIARDTLSHLGQAEIGRSNLASGRSVGAVPKIGAIPLQPLVIEHVKKVGFLRALREAGAMVQDAVKPGSPGARRSYQQKVRQSPDAWDAWLIICVQLRCVQLRFPALAGTARALPFPYYGPQDSYGSIACKRYRLARDSSVFANRLKLSEGKSALPSIPPIANSMECRGNFPLRAAFSTAIDRAPASLRAPRRQAGSVRADAGRARDRADQTRHRRES
jgi:hypothetical protein